MNRGSRVTLINSLMLRIVMIQSPPPQPSISPRDSLLAINKSLSISHKVLANLTQHIYYLITDYELVINVNSGAIGNGGAVSETLNNIVHSLAILTLVFTYCLTTSSTSFSIHHFTGGVFAYRLTTSQPASPSTSSEVFETVPTNTRARDSRPVSSCS